MEANQSVDNVEKHEVSFKRNTTLTVIRFICGDGRACQLILNLPQKASGREEPRMERSFQRFLSITG